MTKLVEKFGKDTAKALGSVIGLTKKDHSGQNVPKNKRAKDAVVDTAKDALVGYYLGGPKVAAAISSSVLASKVIGVRRALKQQKESPKQMKTVAEAMVESIITKNYDEANRLTEEAVKDILAAKLFEMKKITSARLSEAMAEIKVGNSRLAEPSLEDRLRRDYNDSISKEELLDDRREKEINTANLGVHPETRKPTSRGPETIIDYKNRKSEYFKKAAGAAVRIHGEDVEAAAKHMHGLVTSVENAHEPWIHTHKEYDDINKSTFETLIRGHLRDRADLNDPAKREAMARSAAAKRNGDQQRAMQKMATDHAMAAYLAKKQGKPIPSPPWEKKSSSEAETGKRINDEIPYKE